jgi:uncharacterized membrane protein
MIMTPLSKRLLIALAISGALNLLCAGLLVGSAIHRARMRAERAHFQQAAHGARSERRGGEGKRDARRGAAPFGGILAAHRDELVQRRRAVVEARRTVERALEAQPFDAALLDSSLANLRHETTTSQELVHETLARAARDGDAETRRKIAAGFAKLGPSGP